MKHLLCLLLTVCLLLQAGWSLGESHLEGKPWVNPELPGNVPAVRPALEADYFLHVIHEQALQPTPKTVNDTYSTLTPAHETLRENVQSLISTGDSTEAQILRLLTGRIEDADRRTREGTEPLMTRIRRVRSAQSLDALSALTREDGLLCGTPYAFLQLEAALDASGRFALSILPTEIVPFVEPDGDLPEFTGDLPYDTKKVEAELTFASYTPEEARALALRLADLQKACQNPDSQMNDGADFEPEGMVTTAELRALCTPLADQLTSQGLLPEEGEGTGLFQVRDLPYFRILQKHYTGDNLDLFQALLCLGMVRWAGDYLEPARYLERRGLTGEADLKEAAWQFLRGPATLLTEQAYADAFIPASVIQEVRDVFGSCRDTLADILRKSTWLSEDSRASAVRKVEQMQLVMAPQAERIDFEPLLQSIRDDSLTLLDTVIQVDASMMRVWLHTSGTPYDRGRRLLCSSSFIDVDAVYEPSRNVVVLMCGMLLGDFYHHDTKEELLATIGQTLAHEMGHGFDGNGIQHDAEGTSVCVLTEQDMETYRTKVMRHVEALSRIALSDDLNQDGMHVIHEALADLTGLRVVLDIAGGTDGFDYDLFFRTLSRKFFRAFATREAAYSNYASDPHPAPFVRINYIAPQFDAFYLTYPSVVEGTPMYISPDQRETLW